MSSSIWNLANSQLRDLVSYEPGKPVEDVARELGPRTIRHHKAGLECDPVARPRRRWRRCTRRWERVHFYPDGGGFYLREAIADAVGFQTGERHPGQRVERDHRVYRATRFLRPGDEVITARHAFAVYALMAAALRRADYRNTGPRIFVYDLEAMAAAITPRTREVFITNPNNPTGTTGFAGGDRPIHEDRSGST